MKDKVQELYQSMTPEQKSMLLVQIMEKEVGTLIGNIKNMDVEADVKLKKLEQLRVLAEEKINEIYKKETSFSELDYKKVLSECLDFIDREIEALK